jgi:hypothetical protein
VLAVHIGPYLLGGPPEEQKIDLSVEFDSADLEIMPHWKVRIVSPLEALALQSKKEKSDD